MNKDFADTENLKVILDDYFSLGKVEVNILYKE